jgi:hypothetical protein
MYRSCPATGRLGHRFDKQTHRCACGRWERGYKPQCVPVRPRAECQICERKQALDTNGYLGHHGYKRPGWGFIQGDCFGVHHKPYPATDALEAYLIALQNYIAACRKNIANLKVATELKYEWKVGYGAKAVKKERVMTPGAKGGFEFEERHHFPSFEELRNRRIAIQENEIAFAEKDVKRIKARIEAATEDKAHAK